MKKWESVTCIHFFRCTDLSYITFDCWKFRFTWENFIRHAACPFRLIMLSLRWKTEVQTKHAVTSVLIPRSIVSSITRWSLSTMNWCLVIKPSTPQSAVCGADDNVMMQEQV